MDFLEKVKGLFTSFKFEATAQLKDSGKELHVEGNDIIEGSKVYIITKDTEIPIPDDTWELENELTISTVDGMIVSVHESTEDEPEEITEEVKMEAVEDKPEEITEEVKMEAVKEVDAPVETPTDVQIEPEVEAVIEEAVVDTEVKITNLELVVNELITKVDGVMSKFSDMIAEHEKTKIDIEHRFKEVSTVPSIKKMDKEEPKEYKNTKLGSYKDMIDEYNTKQSKSLIGSYDDMMNDKKNK